MSRGSHMVTGYVGLTPVWASPKKSCSITAVPQLCPLGQPLEERIQRVCCCGCSISQERMVLQPLCKPRERWCCVRLCYGCCVSQERINVSAVPTAPQVSFQPLTSHLACSGFSKQSRKCEQWATAGTKPAFAWLCYSLHPRSHTECFEWYIRGFKPLNTNENIIFMTNFLIFASRDKESVLENLPLEKHPTYPTHLNYLKGSARKTDWHLLIHIKGETTLWGLTELRTHWSYMV